MNAVSDPASGSAATGRPTGPIYPRLRAAVLRLIDVPHERFPDPVIYWRARSLRTLMVITFVMLVAALPLAASANQPREVLRGLLTTASCFVVALGLYWLAGVGKRGMTIAGWVVVPGFLIAQTVSGLLGQGIVDPALCGCMSSVVCAGLLLGARGALVISGLSLLSILLLGWQSIHHWSPAHHPPLDGAALRALMFSAGNTVLFIAVLIVLWENVHKHLQAQAVVNARAGYEAHARAEALAELHREKSRFFSNISHELRTPLTLALGGIEEVLGDPRDRLDQQHRERLEMVRRNDLRLLRLVNALLDFARLEAGRSEALYEPVDLAGLTRDLASEFRSAMERAGLRLVVDCPPLPEPIYADRLMWEKIVLNLVGNAFKFTLSGEVAITLRVAGDRGDRVELLVRDTGRGMGPEERAHLFERFHRAPAKEGARTHEGSGIGLALVKELCELHGGSVSVHSAPGEGSTFTVSLRRGRAHLPAGAIGKRPQEWLPTGAAPYVEDTLHWLGAQGATRSPEAPPTEDPGAAGQPAGTRPYRILLVEDNADMRDYLGRLLCRRFAVSAVPSAEEALAALGRELPDLVLSDVMMPGMGGLGLLRALRRDGPTRTLPVILLSARAGEESVIEGLDVGADDYLIKPFSSRELLARVAAHLLVNRVRQEHAEEKEVLMRVVSHELRGPLTALKGYTQMAHARLQRSGAPEAEYLARMRRPLQRVETLANDLVDLAHIERDQLKLVMERCDLVPLCRQVADEQEAATGRKFELHLPEGPVMVDADAVRIGQVLTNLTTNAIKYSPEDLPVTLRLSAGAAEAVVAVRDRGPGIPPEHLAHVFERFYRAHRESGPAGPGIAGMGLGLYICHELLLRHRGRIWAESTVGQGSTFSFALPLSGSATATETS